MTHPVIKTENYLLVVDDSEIKNWYYWNELDREIRKNNNINHSYHKKIIFHLPLKNAPTLEGVPLLPPLEDEVDKLAEQHLNSLHNEDIAHPETYDVYTSFKEGHNKAKDNQYTILKEVLMEFDLAIKKHLLLYPIEHSVHSKMCDGINEIRSKIIQSLQQPKYPVAFECEIDNILSYNADDGINALINLNFGNPKTITNSQGLTELVGRYIYES